VSGNCKSCVYVVETRNPGADAPPLMNCHRFPPTGLMVMVQVKASPANPQGIVNAPGSVWPPVGEGQWCGEYIAKPFKGNAPS
jgi:hypothetical protein